MKVTIVLVLFVAACAVSQNYFGQRRFLDHFDRLRRYRHRHHRTTSTTTTIASPSETETTATTTIASPSETETTATTTMASPSETETTISSLDRKRREVTPVSYLSQMDDVGKAKPQSVEKYDKGGWILYSDTDNADPPQMDDVGKAKPPSIDSWFYVINPHPDLEYEINK